MGWGFMVFIGLVLWRQTLKFSSTGLTENIKFTIVHSTAGTFFHNFFATIMTKNCIVLKF